MNTIRLIVTVIVFVIPLLIMKVYFSEYITTLGNIYLVIAIVLILYSIGFHNFIKFFWNNRRHLKQSIDEWFEKTQKRIDEEKREKEGTSI